MKSVAWNWLMTGITLGISMFMLYITTHTWTINVHDNINIFKYKPKNYGVIFINDGAKGIVRKAASQLPLYGYHTLIGVKDDSEIKSFSYETNKGIEPIIFDSNDPATLANVIYRLRKIKRDLDRPFAGLLINLADYFEESKQEYEQININQLEQNYKSLLKGPVRLLQAMLDFTQKQIEDELESKNKVSPIFGYEIRIVVVGLEVLKEEELEKFPQKHSLQNAFINILESMNRTQEAFNISVSIIKCNTTDHIIQPMESNANGMSLKQRYRQIQQYMINQIQWSVVNEPQISSPTNCDDLLTSDSKTCPTNAVDTQSTRIQSKYVKSIIHALVASNPLLHYE